MGASSGATSRLLVPATSSDDDDADAVADADGEEEEEGGPPSVDDEIGVGAASRNEVDANVAAVNVATAAAAAVVVRRDTSPNGDDDSENCLVKVFWAPRLGVDFAGEEEAVTAADSAPGRVWIQIRR